MLKIKTYDKDKMFLREHLGEVTMPDGENISISMNADGAAILFHTPDAIYSITLRALMDEVLLQRAAGAASPG